MTKPCAHSPSSDSRKTFFFLMLLALIGIFPLQANPTGGAVTSGSATIHSAPGTTTVNQTSNAAIINWQTFSINHGETTKFLQPSSQSAALNRVLGGGTSQINGTLSANGQVWLINQNGVIVGPGGVVNAAGGFTASTRDITDSNFLKGKAHFVGHGNAGVRNAGQVNSSLGNVILIGKTVDNKGTIQALGTIGLVAGDNVLLGQENADGSTITVNPSPLAKQDAGKTGVTNSGSLSGAAAELKAANGNIYSMAINNLGTIRATTVNHQGGHIWLSSDTGSIVNSGLLNASATVSGGSGGSVVLKSSGTVSHTGTILAQGGTNGTGGTADISGGTLEFTGTVDLTAPDGKTGNLLIDPDYLTVINAGIGTISNGQNDSASTQIDPTTVDTALNTANLTLNADNAIIIANGIMWTSTSTLTLSTNNSGSSININAPISGVNGGLTLNTAGASDVITPSSHGAINVGTFILQNGSWNQNAASGTLASFSAINDFELQNSSTFLRVAAGYGSIANPYQIADVYGLQGIGSPSNNLLGSNFVQTKNIDASSTATWNSGAGFSPIGNGTTNFTGSYNGGNYVISGLTVNLPNQLFVGLFGFSTGSTLQNIGLVGESITGNAYVGGVVGLDFGGTLESSYSTGSVTGSSGIGGLVGIGELQTVDNCYSSALVTGSGQAIGGLMGLSYGTIENSYATGVVNGSNSGTYVGGLVGSNEEGTVESSYATGTVSGTSIVGGLVGNNEGGLIEQSYATGTVSGNGSVGGLAGQNDGTVEASYATGIVSGSEFVGGLVGYNVGSVETSYATGGVSGSEDIGGLVGSNDGSIQNTYSTGAVTGSYNVGGLSGYNDGTVESSYATGAVTGIGESSSVGGLVGFNIDGTIQTSYSTGTVSGFSYVGGLVGSSEYQSTISNCYETGAVWGVQYVGGLLGYNGSDSNGYPEPSVATSYWATDAGGQNGSLSTFGFNSGTVDSYTSGQTLANLQLQSTFDPSWDFSGTWTTNGNTTTPLLQALSFNVSGTAGAGDQVDIISNGTIRGTTTASVNGSYSFFVPADVLSGALVTDLSTGSSDTFYNAGQIPTQGTSVTGLNLASNTLNIQGPGQSSNTLLGNTAGNLSTTAFGINYSVDSSLNLTSASGVSIAIQSPYAIDGNVTASAALSTSSTASLTGVASTVMLSGNSIHLAGPLTSLGSVAFNAPTSATPNITSSGLINVGSFTLSSGYWSQNASGGTLPSFTTATDFELQNSSTFLRVAGGDGSTGNPYQIADIYGIQGIGSPSNSLLAANYLQIQNIYASRTASWNGNAGFSPIGTNTVGAEFTGTYNGGFYTINGLTIDLPYQSNVGLFGYASGSTLQGIGLVGGSITSSSAGGELVGYNLGTVETSYATGTVTGSQNIGGLVGINGGTVETSYATGAVNGLNSATNLGGLVGNNLQGTVQSSFASGTVSGGTGSSNIGGLVGSDSTGGLVETSYSLGTVSGSSNVGGLVGNSTGTVSNSYWLQDTGINVSLSGIGNTSSNVGAAPETTAALQLQSTLTGFDFSLGGIWGINGYNSAGLVNNGLPYFQWQYPTQALISANNQQLVYDGTVGTLDQSQVSVTYNPNNLSNQNSLATLLSSGPTLSILGNNVNVVNSGAANIIALSVTPNSGYTVEVLTAPANATYTPRSVTLSAIDLTASPTTYGNTPFFSNDGAAAGLVNGDSLGGTINYNISDGTSTGGYFNAGTYSYTPVISGYNSNYAVSTAAANFTITPLGLTVTGGAANDKVYDGSTTATLSNVGTITGLYGDVVNIASTGYTANFSDQNAANNKLVTVSTYTLSGADSANYTIAQPSALTASITPKPITLSATSLTSTPTTYGNTPAFSNDGAASGLVTGDTLGGSVTYSNTDSSSTGGYLNAGTFSYTPVISGYNSNYSVSTASANFTITPLALTLSGAAANNKVYDKTSTATLSNLGTITGLNGDLVNLSTTGYSANFANQNAASNKAVTISGYSLTGADSANYTLSQPSLTANISPKPITLSGIDLTSTPTTYGNTPAFSNSGAVGLLNGDTLGGSITYSTTDATSTGGYLNAGTFSYSPVISGYNSNYSVSSASANFTITPLTLTVSGAATNNKVYDGTAAATLGNPGSISGLNGDVVNLATSGYSANFADQNVANNKAVTVSGYTLYGADSANYTITQPTGLTANITPKSINLSAVDITGTPSTYGNTPAFSNYGAASGLVNGDSLGGTISYATSDSLSTGGYFNAGTFSYTPVISGYNPNYFVSTFSANFTITPLTLAVSGTAANNKVYNGSAAATLGNFGTITGLSGDAVNLVTSGYSANFADQNAANNKAVTVSGYTLSGADSGNYLLTQPTGLTANITPKAITLSAISLTSTPTTYGNAPAFSNNGAAGGLVGSDTLGGSITYSTTDSTSTGGYLDAGTFSYAPVISGYNSNYSVSTASANFTVTPLALTVNGAAASNMVYNGGTTAILSNLGTISGLNGDSVSLATSGYSANFANKNAANNKAVTVTGYSLNGADSANYTLTQPTGLTANITPKPITLSAISLSSTPTPYGNTPAFSNNGASSGLVNGDSLGGTISYSNTDSSSTGGYLDAGTFTYTPLISGYNPNYAVSTASANFIITPLALTVSGAAANNKIYNGTATATLSNVGTITGLNGDLVTLSTTGYSANFADKNAANNKAVTVSTYTLTGADSGNYTITPLTGLTANITPKPITLSAVSLTSSPTTYGNTPAFTNNAASSGLVTGDTLGTITYSDTDNISTGGYLDVGTYNYTPVIAGSNPNYLVSTASASFTIAPLALSVTGTAANNKVYDGTTSATLSNLGTISGLSGDNVNLVTTGYSATFSGQNVANSIAITVSGYTLNGADSANYTLPEPQGLKANITPKPVTITGANLSSVVYGNTPAFASSITGLINGDSLGAMSYGVGDGVSSSGHYNAGTYNYTPEISGLNQNYSVQSDTPGTFSITPKPISLSGVNLPSKSYGSTPGFATTAPGLLTGDSLGILSYGVTDGVSSSGHYNAGTYSYNPQITGLNPNYSIQADNSATFTITPAPITLSALNLPAVSYGSTPAFAYSASGVLAGDQLSGSVNYTVYDALSPSGHYNAGSYSYVPGWSGYNPNYVVQSINSGSFTITPLTLVYNAGAAAGVAGQPIPSLGGYMSGFLTGDTLANSTTGTLQFVTPATPSSPTGSYPISGTGLSANNYVFAQAPGNNTALYIAPAPIPVFNPNAHGTQFDNAHNNAYDYAFLYAQQNAEYNAQSNAWLAALVYKKQQAVLNARYEAYRWVYFGN